MSTRLMVQIDDDMQEFPEDFGDKRWIVILDDVRVLDVGRTEEGSAIVTNAGSVTFKPRAEIAPQELPIEPNIWDDLVSTRINVLLSSIVVEVQKKLAIGKLRAEVAQIIANKLGLSAVAGLSILDGFITYSDSYPNPMLTEWLKPIAEEQLKSKLTKLMGDEVN